MKCPECGKNNSSSFKFCQFCGHSLSSASDSSDSDSLELPTSTLSIPDDFDDWFVDGDNPHPSIFSNVLEEDEKAPVVFTTGGKALASKEKAASQAKATDKSGESSKQIRLSPKLAPSKSNGIPKPEPQKKPEKPAPIPAQKPVKKSTETPSAKPAETPKKHLSKPKIFDRVKTPEKQEKQENRQLKLNNPVDANQVLTLNERVLPEPEKRNCPKCGELLSEGHNFCGNCGHRVVTLRQTEPQYDPVCDDGVSQGLNDRVLMSSMSIQNAPRDSMTFGQIHVMPGTTQEYAPYTFCHIKNDGTEGESFQLLIGENIIGRGSSEALRNDQFVSPKHARLVCSEEKVIIEDFNSLNGVFFRLSNESIILYNGDIFRIGEELLLYAHGNSEQPLLTNPRGENSELIGGEESQGWGYLRSILGPFSEGNVYRLWQPTVTLGRTRANITVPLDGFVSGTHASLKVQKDYAILTDLNSSNGTFVRLKDPMEITDTAHILIGNQLIRISHH